MPNSRFETSQGDTIRILLSPRDDDDRKLLEPDLAYRPRLAKSLDILAIKSRASMFVCKRPARLELRGSKRFSMKIRAGYEISYDCPQPTPMILTLSVHPSRVPDLLTPDRMRLDPPLPR